MRIFKQPQPINTEKSKRANGKRMVMCVLQAIGLATSLFAQTPNIEDLEVRIPLNALGENSVEELQIEIPACKYNKSFAVSLTGDDSLMGIYQRAFHYIQGWYVDDKDIFHADIEEPTQGITPERTLTHTDGCGNKIPFRLSTNWMTGKEGQNIHLNGNKYLAYMWWSELSRFIDYQNGIMNHGGGDQSKPRESILKNQQEIVENIGFAPFALGVPGGTSGYPEEAENLPDLYYMEAGTFSNPYPRLDELSGNLYKKRFARINTDTKVADELKTLISNNASDNRWINLFCHNIKNGQTKVNGQLNTSDCFALLDYIYDTYGSGGADNVWFASGPEIYEYTYTRNNSIITHEVVGTELVIRIKAAYLPLFYFKDITLKLTGKKHLALDDKLAFSNNITRLSSASNQNEALINLCFSSFPVNLAEKYTAGYEISPNETKRKEALLFIENLVPHLQPPFKNRLSHASIDLPNDKKRPLFFIDPSGNELHFHTLSDDPCKVTIYSLSGIPVTIGIVSAQSSRIPIGKLPKGIYNVVVEGKSNVQSTLFPK